jgi:hypothetical protein
MPSASPLRTAAARVRIGRVVGAVVGHGRRRMAGPARALSLSLYVRDDGLDPRPGVAALRQVAGHGERGVSLVARGEDVCDDVRDGERRELGDWPVEQPCVPLAPLGEQIVVGHRSLD